MKLLYNWLKEFVPLEISPQETADTLARLGFEVASVQTFGGPLEGVVTAEVREVGKHPNADRLSLCKVFDGQHEFSVVCGAPNVKEGQRVPLARIGAVLPNGLQIKAAKLRGVESQGMICSRAELGLEEKSEGILELDPVLPLGADIRPILGLDDTLIEIEVTPNRRDALSILGVARELAAAFSLPLKMPEPRVRELDIANSVTLSNDARDLCPRYIARAIRDIQVGASPEWMIQRLTRCGFRSINNIVDTTNYVMLELGQPLHAFDAAKLKGRHIQIRRAKAGEKMLLLDGQTVELQEGLLVIADESSPAALAGVMGGEASAIDAGTREVILESAAFYAPAVRQASKTLGVSSESSYRFERGTDWNMVAFASRRAAQLIQELAGGLGFKPLEISAQPPIQPTIKLRIERIRQFLGIEFKEATAAALLRRLGCEINMGTGQLHVNAPSWRLDITTEADLMEELTRLHGYDNIPARAPAIRITGVPEDPWWSFEQRISKLLSGFGLNEVVNYTFLSQKQAFPFIPGLGQSPDAQPVGLANPLSQEQAVLRTCLLPAILQNAVLNFHHQMPGVSLFEIGRIFYKDHDGLHEQRRLGIVLGGEIVSHHWRGKKRSADYFDLTGFLTSLQNALHLPPIQITPCRIASFHPRRSSMIVSGSTVIGWFGELHPELVQELDTENTLVAAELDLAALRQILPATVTYKPLNPFPAVYRDLSVTSPLSVPYEKIAQTLRTSGGVLLESVSLIDLFQGEKIGKDRRSLTVSLLFRHRDRTLDDADVEKVMQKIITDLEKKCEAVLRK
ncbi:MAG: phenylalanine--tRNA ligase subunit beta [Elusimicrobiota bacterium]|jgi:phenylalanyl-tRNA synthetase beta chain